MARRLLKADQKPVPQARLKIESQHASEASEAGEKSITGNELKHASDEAYEAFRRENPGKAHFTRKQWEQMRQKTE